LVGYNLHKHLLTTNKITQHKNPQLNKQHIINKEKTIQETKRI